jgi:hypothetical protein
MTLDLVDLEYIGALLSPLYIFCVYFFFRIEHRVTVLETLAGVKS